MRASDTSWMRDESGYTLTELIVVVVVIGILSIVAMGFHARAREQAADATARSNIRVAIPAIETYRADVGGYTGMTLATLQAAYSPGVQGIEVVAADAVRYCVRSTTPGRAWYRDGPSGPITTSACS
jgi:prepilin-type N-terminal cleavage/methylation domain-containing protein